MRAYSSGDLISRRVAPSVSAVRAAAKIAHCSAFAAIGWGASVLFVPGWTFLGATYAIPDLNAERRSGRRSLFEIGSRRLRECTRCRRPGDPRWADITTRNNGVSHEITLVEEEISDVSLATFFVFEKENAETLRPGVRLAMGGCGAGGCGGCGCWTGTNYSAFVFGTDVSLPYHSTHKYTLRALRKAHKNGTAAPARRCFCSWWTKLRRSRPHKNSSR